MDYTELIKSAWRTTWRYRFLWVLALFAGGAAGTSIGGGRAPSGVQWRMAPGDLNGSLPTIQNLPVESWLAAKAGLIAMAVIVAVLLSLAALVVSFIAQGGMAQATTDLALGRPTSLRAAWGAGVRLFWRYVGLWLLLVAIAIAVAVLIAALVAVGIGIVAVGQASELRVALGITAVLLAIVLGIAAIAAAIGASIIVTYAQRAIVAEDVGPVAGLRSGWILLRDHPGTSALVWLVNVALSIAVAIGVALAVAIAAAVLGLPGALLWSLAGLSSPTVAYITLGVVALLAVVLLLSAISNAFFWNYWSLAYLRLSGKLQGESASTSLG